MMMSINPEKLFRAFPLGLSICALLVSAIGLVYTARTYAVSHRPYIGIVEIPFQLVEGPPRGITWHVVIKNVGNLPGFLTVDEYSVTLTSSAGFSSLPVHGVGRVRTLLMPGATTHLLGQYMEGGGPVLMNDILGGSATMNVTVKLSYDFPSWLWSDQRYYVSSIRFLVVKGFAPFFSIISAEAN
jgi:hypothetical protein